MHQLRERRPNWRTVSRNESSSPEVASYVECGFPFRCRYSRCYGQCKQLALPLPQDSWPVQEALQLLASPSNQRDLSYPVFLGSHSRLLAPRGRTSRVVQAVQAVQEVHVLRVCCFCAVSYWEPLSSDVEAASRIYASAQRARTGDCRKFAPLVRLPAIGYHQLGTLSKHQSYVLICATNPWMHHFWQF